MKKAFALLLVMVMLLAFTACGNEAPTNNSANPNESTTTTVADSNENNTSDEENNSTENETPNIESGNFDSLDAIEAALTKDTADTISALETEWEELKAEITTFDKYVANVDKVEAFYNKVNTETASLCKRLCGYTLNYAEFIMATDDSTDDKYDSFDEIYDCVYEDAGDDIYDEIYDGILDDMYNVLYDGVLDDAYDTVSYDEWSDARSTEYDWWSDTRSDVYDEWSDTRSDIYDFWSDMRGELWDDDIEKATEKMEEFKEDIQ